MKLIYDEQKKKMSFEYLDAPQLLKHILGLNYETRFKEKGFTFLYLWYEIPSLEADKHRSEIESFKKAIGQDVDFQVLTYQELFHVLSNSLHENTFKVCHCLINVPIFSDIARS